jgi:hypothetical protein
MSTSLINSIKDPSNSEILSIFSIENEFLVFYGT